MRFTTRAPAISSIISSLWFTTIAEAGIEGLDAQTWFGLLGPEKNDANVVQKLSDALDIVLTDPKFNKTILAQGMEVKGGTPQQFISFFQSEYEKWG